jgi:tRNA-2-methylthio-N6-dimethylallyladenosine synthase
MFFEERSPVSRIRFATSHPRDMSYKIVQAVAACRKVCEQIHLPVQSGSDRILKRMGRGYTREEYRDLVAVIKRLMPEVSITTDERNPL